MFSFSDPDNINRIGIILNFIAGFLLAPELFGRERIVRLEVRLERLGKAFQSVIGDPVDERDIGSGDARRALAAIFIASLVFPFAFWWWMWREVNFDENTRISLGFVSLAMTVVMLLIRPGGIPTEKTPKAAYKVAILTVLNAVIVIGSLATYGSVRVLPMVCITFALLLFFHQQFSLSTDLEISNRYLILLLVAISLIMWPTFAILSALAPIIGITILVGRYMLYIMDPEQDRLQDRLVSLGIVTFIVGNALQFVATY